MMFKLTRQDEGVTGGIRVKQLRKNMMTSGEDPSGSSYNNGWKSPDPSKDKKGQGEAYPQKSLKGLELQVSQTNLRAQETQLEKT